MHEAKTALLAWSKLGQLEIERVPVGLINQTFRVYGDAGQFILQRLHKIFAATVNQDIEAVTEYLHARGFCTPLLCRTDEGALWTMVDDACWRLQTFVDGTSFDQMRDPDMASSAGELVGRFHGILSSFEHTYNFVRKNVHDTASYLSRLEKAVDSYKNHDWYDRVARQADQVFRAARQIPDLSNLPRRNSHGDLKISNLLFNDQMQATCMIDLDTVGLMPWPIEMGDAFRSWCNPAGENTTHVIFSEAIFNAALRAYAKQTKHLWTREEIEALWHGIEIIPLELSTRFLLDVLEDQYWAWDKTRFTSRAEHNWLRSMGQWSLCLDIQRQSKIINTVIKQAFVS